MTDEVDGILAAWRVERPDLDVGPPAAGPQLEGLAPLGRHQREQRRDVGEQCRHDVVVGGGHATDPTTATRCQEAAVPSPVGPGTGSGVPPTRSFSRFQRATYSGPNRVAARSVRRGERA